MIAKLRKTFKDFKNAFNLKTKKDCDVCETEDVEHDPEFRQTMPYELRQIFNNDRISFQDIDLPPNFNSQEDFHIILSDDNAGALALMEIDLEIILGSAKIPQLKQETIEKFESLRNLIHKNPRIFDVQKLGGNYAPYSICRKLELDPTYRVDFAVIDIVFGGLVYDEDQPIILDGARLAKRILESNPKAEVVLFTGCNLNAGDEVYEYILENLGEDFLNNNIIFKNPDFANRLTTYTNLIKKAYTSYLDKDHETSK